MRQKSPRNAPVSGKEGPPDYRSRGEDSILSARSISRRRGGYSAGINGGPERAALPPSAAVRHRELRDEAVMIGGRFVARGDDAEARNRQRPIVRGGPRVVGTLP